MGTKIPYVDEAWNPICGCSKCSPGCENCWAEKFACRLSGMERKRVPFKPKYDRVVDKGKWVGNVICDEKALNIPLHWRKPRKILTCSMSDWCHPKVPFEFRDKMLAVATMCHQHEFWFLTKRVKEMAEYFNRPELWTRILPEAISMSLWDDKCIQEPVPGYIDFNAVSKTIRGPLPNVHLGATICNQKEMDEKGPILLSIPAAHHWISFEPLLGPIEVHTGSRSYLWGNPYVKAIDFAVIGCESLGNKKPGRPCKREWILSLVEQCKAAGVPYTVKQREIDGKVCHDLQRIKAELGD